MRVSTQQGTQLITARVLSADRDVPLVLLAPVETSGSLMPVTYVERTNTLGVSLHLVITSCQ